jgi:hypothetical protein
MHTRLCAVRAGRARAASRRPVRGWLGAICFSLAGAAVLWRDGVVPDPLVAGAAAPGGVRRRRGVRGGLYVIAVAASLAARRQE